eukprot:2459947-Amphidinium_carterae.1
MTLYEHEYFVCGSFNSWDMHPMDSLLEDETCWEASVSAGPSGKFEFRIVRDRDLRQSIYPASSSSEESVPVCGPDSLVEGRSFVVNAAPNEIVIVARRSNQSTNPPLSDDSAVKSRACESCTSLTGSCCRTPSQLARQADFCCHFCSSGISFAEGGETMGLGPSSCCTNLQKDLYKQEIQTGAMQISTMEDLQKEHIEKWSAPGHP